MRIEKKIKWNWSLLFLNLTNIAYLVFKLFNNFFSSSLFLTIVCCLSLKNSFSMMIDTNRGAWSERFLKSGEI